MAQDTAIKSTSSQMLLSFNMKNIDTLFPGFMLGDFALMHGLSSVLPLSLLLAVKAQLPYQLGGLESSTVFVDGGNTFQLYRTSRIARLNGLSPRKVLTRIFISRAFTAHQMTAIILEKLEETVKKFDAKLVILSDFTGLYLDKDIQPEEAKSIFTHVATYLSRFAEQAKVVVLATCPPHYYSRRNAFFHAVACSRSNVTISIQEKRLSCAGQQFVLEKHPLLRPGSVDFPSENLKLNDFDEADQ
jgi:hypothetical protein